MTVVRCNKCGKELEHIINDYSITITKCVKCYPENDAKWLADIFYTNPPKEEVDIKEYTLDLRKDVARFDERGRNSEKAMV